MNTPRLGVIVLFACLRAVCAFAEIPKADSLKISLLSAKTDTGRVMLYNSIAREIATTAYLKVLPGEHQYYDTAILYADSGLTLAENINFRKGEAEIYRTIGAIVYYSGKYDEAILNFEKSLQISSEIGSDYSKAAVMLNLGITYEQQGKYVPALEYLLLASSLFDHDGNHQWQFDINYTISTVYSKIGEPGLSIEYGDKALQLIVASKYTDMEQLITAYRDLADPYLAKRDTAKGIEYYEKAINLFHNTNNQHLEASVLQNYANNIFLKTNPRKAIKLFTEASKLYEKVNPQNYALAQVYQGLSTAYKTIGKRDSSVYYRDKALKTALLSKVNTAIAETYVWMGNEMLEDGQTSLSESYFHSAQKANKGISSAKTDANIYAGLSKIYQKQGNTRKAFETMRLVVTMRDSLILEENKRRLEVVQMQYELKERKEKLDLELKRQAENQKQSIIVRRRIIISISIAFVLLAALLGKVIVNLQRNKRKNFLLREWHEEVLQIQEELRQSNDELSMHKEYLEDMVREKTAEQADKDMQLHSMNNNLTGGFIYRKIVDEHGQEQLSYISSNVEKLLGISSGQLVGEKADLVSLLGDSDFIARFKKKEQDCARNMQPFTFEFQIISGGRKIWLFTHALPHTSKQNNSIVWDGFVIDITKQKEVEISLKTAKVKAEEADRLKSVFLSNMSHEIRTPMNAIMGFISFVEKEELPAAKRSEYIAIIQNSVNQLLRLIENIIDISKLEVQQIVIHPSEFELNRLMKEIENSWLDATVGKPLHLFLDSSLFLEQDMICNDRERLKRVLFSLIDNAVKYTEKGYIRFGYEQEGSSELKFFVEDTGIGIAESQDKIIFEYFRQGVETELKPKYGGTGLGLSISKGLVELMGGSIWVESKMGEGSVFYFTIKKNVIEN